MGERSGHLRRVARRAVPVMMAALAVGAMASCGDDGDDGSAGGSGGGGNKESKPLVGFINGDVVEFNQCVSKGLKATLGDTAEIVELNSHGNPQTELTNGEDLLARNPKALVIQTINFKSGATLVAQADRAGVPVFLTSVAFTDPKQIAGAVIFDTADVGKQIGDYVTENLTKDGPKKIAVIAGAPGAASDLIANGFLGALKGDPNAEVVFNQPGFWDRTKAAGVAENMIQAQPELDYVFVLNEDMAFGVAKAIEAADKQDQIKILTQNGTPEGLEAVKSGEFLATEDGSAYSAGASAGENLTRILDGEQLAQKIETVPTKVITKDDVDQADPYCGP